MGLNDKQKFLSGLEIEDKNTFTKLYDRAQRAARFGGTAFGEFLSMAEQSRLMQREKYLPDAELSLFGGFDDAERRMAGFNADEADFPVSAVEIRGRGTEGLSHRDYLGSLMGLGIERGKIGDIVLLEQSAAAFVHSDIAQYIENTLLSVGKCTVTARVVSPGEIAFGERRFTEITGTVASLRLDSAAAMLIGKGRSAACDLIRAGKVFVNGITSEKADAKINDGDIITVRGFGKAVVEIGGRSKKDRIFVTLKKYA